MAGERIPLQAITPVSLNKYSFDNELNKISGPGFGKEGLAGGDLAFQQQKYGEMVNEMKGFNADGTAGGN